MKAVQIRCMGRVQGVFYRASTQQKAMALGLTGWVKNMDNGDVMIFAQGQTSEVSELIEWCRVGPKNAQVRELEVVDARVDVNLKGFEVKMT